MIPMILALIAIVVLFILIFIKLKVLKREIDQFKTEIIYWKELFEETKKERDDLMNKRVVIKKMNSYNYD